MVTFTLSQLKLYTYKVNDENFGEKISIKKILFDLEILGKDRTFYIVFDEIPSIFKLRKFINKLVKSYNGNSTFLNELTQCRIRKKKLLKEIKCHLKIERKYRKIEKDDDYKSYKIFINDKRVYNKIIVIEVKNVVYYTPFRTDEDILSVNLDYIWSGPIISGGERYASKNCHNGKNRFIKFSDIQF